MKKSAIIKCGLIFTLLLFRAIAFAQELDSESFLPLTRVENKIKTSSFDSYSIEATIIHPSITIKYPYSNLNLEKKLKNDYDMILIKVSSLKYDASFSIYKSKKTSFLIVDGIRKAAVDFYDFEISSSSYAYFSEYTFDYTSSSSASVKGYLLFPKSITNSTKKVVLMFGEQKFNWNFEKITKMVDILK